MEYRRPFVLRLRRWIGRFPLFQYLAALLAMTLVFGASLVALMDGAASSGWRFGLLAVLALLAGSELASALANWLSTLLMTPQLLPRMDYSQGLPPEDLTLVVVPSLLVSERNVEELLDALEVRFLGNRDPHLLFALLTDFSDAAAGELPGDGALLASGTKRNRETQRQVPGRRDVRRSSCFTGREPGIRASASGWVTSASAASWRT